MFDAYWKLGERLAGRLEDAWAVRNDRRLRRDRHRWLALEASARPFNELGMPRLRGPGRLRGGRAGLFWFDEDSAWQGCRRGTVLLSARAMAFEMSRWGIEIREIRIAAPGRVLWRDPYQVLAVPHGTVPRAFA